MAKHVRHHAQTLKRIVKRLLRLRKRTKIIAVTAVVLNTCFLLQLYANLFVYPNTYLGKTNISGKTKAGVTALLARWNTMPYEVRVKGRIYTYSYADMGVIIDADSTLKDIFIPNTRPFPISILGLLGSLRQTRMISPTVGYTQQFSRFAHETVFDFGDGAGDSVLLSAADKTLVYMENEEKYRFDEAQLRTLLTLRLGNNGIPLYPQLKKVENREAIAAVSSGEKLRKIFDQPLPVYVDASGNIKQFFLSEKELINMTSVDLTPDGEIRVGIHTPVFDQILNNHVHKLGFLVKNNVATPKVAEDFIRTMTDRSLGGNMYALRIGLDDGPNTTGSLADKYIEVDISQQRMYLFKGRKMTKSYRVSTGSEYPTPVGKFEILNKTGLGFTTIYDSWLPWWMGFAYSRELNAYFGIHEIPYKLVDGTQTIQRQYSIDQPNTGGCVALDVGAAREVYLFADIGTPVVIYN